MSGYKHGVYVSEQATSILPPVQVDAALPVVFGTAPVHTLEAGVAKPINEPRLIYSYAEFVEQFGWDDDLESWTLCEFAKVYLSLYGVCPVVFVNVFDPATHKDESEQPDVTKVLAADIIGGVDSGTGARTGLELVEEVFPRFLLTPGQILAPKYSADPAVAVVMAAKCESINGHFRCTSIAEVPDTVARYTDVPAWRTSNNLTDPNLVLFFGRPKLGDVLHRGSSHQAGIIATRDADNDGVPFWSPSNARILANTMTHAGESLHLTPDEAAYLNGQGICTGLNFIGGLVSWGNRTAAYPGSTDPKDTWIPVRRMFSWIGNTLVQSAWQRADAPLRRRLAESICDSFNIWLNGLTAREFILGGRVAFLESENPATDLMDGIARFHLWVSPPPPARDIEFILEYDPDYLSTLFGAS